MFLGRHNELASLEKLYKKPGFQMAILYGRRRVGKTSLITEFCRQKKHIFYVSIAQNDKAALASFSEKVLEAFPEAKAYINGFQAWETAFRYIADRAKDKRIVLVIDEYPYLASGNPSISSVLQRSIDTEMLQTGLFLILCGSSMSFMENQVLGYESPLYGRRTAQLRIEPFDYLDSSLFFPDYSNEDKLMAYGVAGGIPQYLGYIAKEKNLREGILNNFFDPTGPLYEEPYNFLKQELREPALYNSMITAIASGASRLNEIATKIGEETNKSAKYLKILIDLRLIRKELPYGEGSQRKGIYSVSDNMFRFWYRFIPDNVSNIEARAGEAVLDKRVLSNLPDYMGRVFEDVCMQFILRRNKAATLPFWINSVGRWWGNNPIQKCQEEIDFVAAADKVAIFGECKWRNEPLGKDVFDNLVNRSHLLQQYEARHYMLFSKTGFTSGLKEEALKQRNVELVTPKELFMN